MNSFELFLFVAKKYQLMNIFSKDQLTKISFYSFNETTLKREYGTEKCDFEEHLKKELHGNLYGIYSCSNRAPKGAPNSILLGIRDSLLPKENENPTMECEMIALHEICHYIDWQKLENKIPISLSSCDNIVGKKFENCALDIAKHLDYDDLDHNSTFGAILFHLIRTQYPNDAPSKMQIAVSKTLMDDFTEECICKY